MTFIIVTDEAGQIDQTPRRGKIYSSDSLQKITTPGYLNSKNVNAYPISANDIYDVIYSYNSVTKIGVHAECTVTISTTTLPGVITLVSNQVVSAYTASAAPGTLRAFFGKVVSTASVMTSGTLTGVRGEADIVGASSGFVYGVQGKVIPAGTLSGSVWAPAVFGQYDLSHATINAGQIAAIWGDMGATGGTFTNVTGARMFAGTNTISTLTLNSMIYLYGKATNLFELSGNSSTYISSGGSGVLSGTIQKLAITIDGVTYYIPAATVIS